MGIFLFILFIVSLIANIVRVLSKEPEKTPVIPYDTTNLDKIKENMKAATEKLIQSNAEMNERLRNVQQAPDITFVKKDINSFGEFVDFEEVKE